MKETPFGPILLVEKNNFSIEVFIFKTSEINSAPYIIYF